MSDATKLLTRDQFKVRVNSGNTPELLEFYDDATIRIAELTRDLQAALAPVGAETLPLGTTLDEALRRGASVLKDAAERDEDAGFTDVAARNREAANLLLDAAARATVGRPVSPENALLLSVTEQSIILEAAQLIEGLDPDFDTVATQREMVAALQKAAASRAARRGSADPEGTQPQTDA